MPGWIVREDGGTQSRGLCTGCGEVGRKARLASWCCAMHRRPPLVSVQRYK